MFGVRFFLQRTVQYQCRYLSARPSYIAPESIPLYEKTMSVYKMAQECASKHDIDQSKRLVREAINNFDNIHGEYPAIASILNKMIKFEASLDKMSSNTTSMPFLR